MEVWLMAIYEVPARVKIEISDEADVSSGRRDLITLLTQQWLNICTGFNLKNAPDDPDGTTSIVGIKVFIEDGNTP
jgi:hypothetical protein